MPDDWADIDAMAEAIDRVDAGQLWRHDLHPMVQAVASEMRQFFVHADAVEYDTRWCPEFDESRPETMSRYYLLTYGSNTLYPLSSLEQWTYAARQLLPEPKCNAHITSACHRQEEVGDVVDEDPPVGQVAVSRGEFICVFNICALCFVALRTLTFDDWPLYSGPWPWCDSGPKWFDPANPTVLKDMGIQFNADDDLWGI